METGDILWPRGNNFIIIRPLLFFILFGLSTFSFAQAVEYGKASYYADKFQGRKTASGELYHADSLTAAHRTLSFGTVVKVTNVKSNDFVFVRINDRGPFVQGRVIDLSRKAMNKLNGIEAGLIDVKVEILVDDSLK